MEPGGRFARERSRTGGLAVPAGPASCPPSSAPGAVPDGRQLRHALSGAHLTGLHRRNLDTFAVGRIAGTAVLGQYSRAYYLVSQPLVAYISQALTSVLFSSLSCIQEDSARLRRAYLSLFSLGCVALFSLCAGIAVAAREIVLVVLGSQWSLAIGLVPWFALAGGCHVAS